MSLRSTSNATRSSAGLITGAAAGGAATGTGKTPKTGVLSGNGTAAGATGSAAGAGGTAPDAADGEPQHFSSALAQARDRPSAPAQHAASPTRAEKGEGAGHQVAGSHSVAASARRAAPSQGGAARAPVANDEPDEIGGQYEVASEPSGDSNTAQAAATTTAQAAEAAMTVQADAAQTAQTAQTVADDGNAQPVAQLTDAGGAGAGTVKGRTDKGRAADTADENGAVELAALALLLGAGAAAVLAAPPPPQGGGAAVSGSTSEAQTMAAAAAGATPDGQNTAVDVDADDADSGSATVGGPAGAANAAATAAAAAAAAPAATALLAGNAAQSGALGVLGGSSKTGSAADGANAAGGTGNAAASGAGAQSFLPQLLQDLTAAAGLPGVARSIAVPMSDPNWPQALAAQVHWLASSQIQSATLRLSPEHLGPVQVHIDMQQSQVNVSFSAAHGDTRAALAEAVPRLRAMFAAGGLNLGQATVQQESRSGHDAPRGSSQGLSALQGVEPVAAGGVRALGLVDEYA